MQVVRAMRLRVKDGEEAAFEALAVAQAEKMYAAAPGVVFYVVVRRSESGTMFSDPLPGTSEYLLLAAARDADGAAQLEANETEEWRSSLHNVLAIYPEIEVIEAPDFTVGVSRDMVWTPQSMWRLSLYRMRLKVNDNEFEPAAQSLIARVLDQEPDPRIYTLTKRKGVSTLFPGAPSNRDEYLRFHAYTDEEKGLTWHYKLDAEWWASFYQPRLDGPLEAQQVFAEDIVAGFTRDHTWGNPTKYVKF